MNKEITVQEMLKLLHLSSMVEIYQKQIDNPNIDLLSFDDRFKEIVDYEFNKRNTNKLNRFIRKAKLKYPEASFDDTIYLPDRLLDVTTIEALSNLNWVKEGRNILITGATGAGKTYIANALCVCAINEFNTVYYTKASSLIYELEKAELDKTYLDTLDKYSKYDVLAIDDFGLMELDIDKCRNLFEVIDSREQRKSTIMISQFPVANWYDFFSDNTYAEACIDRLVCKAYRIEMNGINMRNPSSSK